MSISLILSATITPPAGVPALVRVDPAIRLNDYLHALEFYLKLPDEVVSRVVFADNSNSDVSALRQMADRLGGKKEVHILSFDGLDHPAAYGRGYGELKLIDHVVEHCEAVAKLPPETIFWKGTGRYKLVNMARMIKTSPRRFDLYFDLKNRPMPWFDMRFFGFSLAGYRRLLLGRYLDLREDLAESGEAPGVGAAEVTLRRLILPHLGEEGVVCRFRTEPFVDGVRGWDEQSYVRGKNLAKYWIRRAARKVAPWIWI